MRTRTDNFVCPFCKKFIHYWPNCSEKTTKDYGDTEWVVCKGGKGRQYFHRSCYMKHTIGYHNKSKENSNEQF